jgi:hypothetical protein
MTRHVLVGRFDEVDSVRVPKAKDESSTKLMLMHNGRLAHGIGHALVDLAKLGLSPSEAGVDLLVVAAHVHAADTRISRHTEAQDGWTREIRLVVPVSDPILWTQASPILIRALQFLTGDRWNIGFRKRPKGKEKFVVDVEQTLLPPAFDGVSLFSGGLDSLIGAIDELDAGSMPLLVSHAGEPLVSKSQDDVFAGLEAAYPKAGFERMRVWMSFQNELVDGVGAEETTRGRSFLFLSLAAACGSGLQKDFILRVPENGLIALNVPLDELRLGALSTRTTHPFYLSRWNELLKAIGIAGRLDNPYWNKTKGEMVSACANSRLLQKLAPLSLSCSSPAKARWKGKPQGHCGYCLPCLIRRAALRDNDSTSYGIPNLRANPLDSTESVGQQVRSCQLAVRRIKDRPALATALIHKPGPLFDQPDRHAELAGVYRRGLEELGRLLQGVRTEPK